jgi:hypothetical protein
MTAIANTMSANPLGANPNWLPFAITLLFFALGS